MLGFPEVGIGILPSSGGTVRATRFLGAAQAKRLILLGDRLSAHEALAAGLVTEVVADAAGARARAGATARRAAARRRRGREGGDRRCGRVVARRGAR